MRFSLPPWLKRGTAAEQEPGHELVVRQPPPVAIDLAAAEVPDGWTREELAEYQVESDARASDIIVSSMNARRRGTRPRWANKGDYRPLSWGRR